MADLPSRLDFYNIGRDYIVQRATRLDPQKVDVLGTDANIFVGSVSEVAYAIVLQLAFALNRLLLDGAEGADLDRYAFDRYNLTRKGASAAVGSVTFSRALASGPAGTILSGTKLVTGSGFEYITTAAATFTSSAGTASDTTVTAAVRAVQAGKVSQVGANSIVKFSQPGLIFDQTIAVNNPKAVAGGEDAEDDDTFRERIRGFWTTARRGILSAIAFGALQVPGVVSAQAVEVITTGANPARLVNLYIADSSGVASAVLAAQVQTALNDFRAAGIQVIISTSIPQIVSVALHLTFQAGVDTAGLTTQVQTAVFSYVNGLPVNGPLTLAALNSLLQRFVQFGLIVGQGSVVSPTGDIVPAPGSTLRTTLQNITFQ